MAGEEKVLINDDLEAEIVKKRYGQKGPYNNMQLSQSMSLFSGAVSAAHAVASSAKGLKTKEADGQRNKTNNYYLTANEKKLLERRATEFAVPGIVPYDVLEDFLYILCYVDDYPTLKAIADVVGVPGLDSPEIIREPTQLLNVPDLAKISYLSNGLAALTKQYQSERYPQATTASQNDSSSYSSYSKLAGTSNIMSQFSGLGGITSIMTQVTSLATTLQSITSIFSSEGSNATKVTQAATAVTQSLSMFENITRTLGQSGKNNISQMMPLMNQLQNLKGQMLNAQIIMDMSKQVTTSNSFPKEKVDDLNSMFSEVNQIISSVSTGLSSLSSLMSGLKPPNGGNLGKPSETILQLLSGGAAMSSFVAGKILGQEIPQNVLAKNPLALPSTYIGRTMFGQSLTQVPFQRDGKNMPAVPIGIFFSAASGAATAAFSMQNSSAMGGAMSLQSAVSTILAGSSSDTIAGHLANVSNVLGAAATAVTELRRSDNAIPIMIALATSFANDLGNPFPSSVFSEGWKIASAAGNMLQKQGKSIRV